MNMEQYEYNGLGIPDKEFIRGQIPMTKENIRILSVAKLHLKNDSVVYDIGAGTGSVTVEMAHMCKKVYAIEQKEEGCELILKNAEKFQLKNIEVCLGSAPDCLEGLEPPTHVFIGGSSGKLITIIEEVRKKNPQTRFVVNAITLETITTLLELSKTNPGDYPMEIMEVSIANGKMVGNYHMMQGENPIYIACF